jgi:phosphoserine phosphatase RsbU/P
MLEKTEKFENSLHQEFKKTALKYHIIVAWVAFILNPIWSVSDYFISAHHFREFLYLRVFVSLVIFLALLNRKKWVDYPEIIALVPFIGISVQNAYMYSVLNTVELYHHTLAYAVLFIGAGMFVLWRAFFSVLVVGISVFANVLFFSLNSELTFHEVVANGGMLITSVALFSIVLLSTRTKLTRRTISAQLQLLESKQQVESRNELIEEKTKNIEDSINYAQRIQQAIFPSAKEVNEMLADYFIFFQPKDIVSGDFYWFSKLKTTPIQRDKAEEIIVVGAIDCTGHGVPGALMSMLGNTLLNQAITERTINSPAEALEYLDKQLARNLRDINDGMDISLCSINQTKMKLEFSGANNSIYVVRQKELIELKADKRSIGGKVRDGDPQVFINHTFELQKKDVVYLFTDGFADQFGGDKGKKLKYKLFQEILVQNSDFPLPIQREKLTDFFTNWKGDLEQVDDVLVIGIGV